MAGNGLPVTWEAAIKAVLAVLAGTALSHFIERRFPLGSWPWLWIVLLCVAGIYYSELAALVGPLDLASKAIFFLLVVVLLAISTRTFPMERDKVEVAADYHNRIIAEHLWHVLGLFLVSFRINLHCLVPEPPLDHEIRWAFHIPLGVDDGGVERSAVTPELIARLFSRHGFERPMVNTKPEDGSEPMTNAEWLVRDLAKVHEGCDRILQKYGGSGSPELLYKIEVLRNRAGTLVSTLQVPGRGTRDPQNIRSLASFFMFLKQGLDEIETVRKRAELPHAEAGV